MMSTMQTVRPMPAMRLSSTAARKACVVRAEPEQKQEAEQVVESVQADATKAVASAKSTGLASDAQNTLKPRVNELKRQQLSQGTTNAGGEFQVTSANRSS